MFEASQLEPFDDYMVVKVNEDPRKTTGGIMLPHMEKQKQLAATGVVVAIGPGHRLEGGEVVPMDYNPGDVVVFNPYSGSEFELKVGGDKLRFLSQRNTFGRVNPAAVPVGA